MSATIRLANVYWLLMSFMSFGHALSRRSSNAYRIGSVCGFVDEPFSFACLVASASQADVLRAARSQIPTRPQRDLQAAYRPSIPNLRDFAAQPRAERFRCSASFRSRRRGHQQQAPRDEGRLDHDGSHKRPGSSDPLPSSPAPARRATGDLSLLLRDEIPEERGCQVMTSLPCHVERKKGAKRRCRVTWRRGSRVPDARGSGGFGGEADRGRGAEGPSAAISKQRLRSWPS